MDESLNELLRLLDSQSLEDNMEKIRTKIYKEIEKLRKGDDDEFSRKLERLEIFLWQQLPVNNSNLNNLVLIYENLRSLRFNIDRLKDLVNTD